MRRLSSIALILVLSAASAIAQSSSPDPRYKADILLVVAHPDDDTLVSSYLARAIFDQQKRVAVVFCTRGDSGGNAYAREHAQALGLVREIEGRRAMAVLGISNVWFLDGRDTASQDVLVSLASWPHGSVLQQLVRIMRLTQPEVVMTWLPSSVAGENHGDHQASAVIATEAFDLAGSRTIFPSQLAAPVRAFENALEGLRPWQPKKLYFFTDAFDDSFLQGKGPEYPGRDISPSKNVTYLQLAAQSAAPYYTQSPDPKLNQQIEKGKDLAGAVNALTGGEYPFLVDPVRLLLGKSYVPADPTADVFTGITPGSIQFQPEEEKPTQLGSGVSVSLGGTWGFYQDFWKAHGLESLAFRRAEIAVDPGDTLGIPLQLTNNSSQRAEVLVAVTLPSGWMLNYAQNKWVVGAHDQLSVRIAVVAPAREVKNFEPIRVVAQSAGRSVGDATIYVQVRANVAPQLK